MSFKQVVAGALTLALSASGFDTGHHRDLTWSALRAEGFAERPINVVAMANWLPDFYAIDVVKENVNCTVEYKATCVASKDLHFDNLDDVFEVEHYWRQLASNTKRTVQQFAHRDDAYNALAILVTLGASLHAVQDFYTHSNWNKLNPRLNLSYTGRTWWNYVEENGGQVPKIVKLYTGDYPSDIPARGRKGEPHSGPTETPLGGLNKDYYGRADWDEAYVFAYVASRQWVRAVRQWVTEVNPAIWDRCVRGLVVEGAAAGALDNDIADLYGLSAWSGHWKGPGSLYKIKMAGRWATFGGSSFILDTYRVLSVASFLAKDLYSVPAVRQSSWPLGIKIPPIQFDERVIIVSTKRAASIVPNLPFQGIFGLLKFRSSDPTLDIEVKESPWRGASPPPLNWQTLVFANSSLGIVSIDYSLWAEQSDPPSTQQQLDINPKNEKAINFTFAPTSSSCSGGISTCSEGQLGVSRGTDAEIALHVKSAKIVIP